MTDAVPMNSNIGKHNIVIAVADPLIHPEVSHIVAATGHGIIDAMNAEEARRVQGRGRAVVVDKAMAEQLGDSLSHPQVLFVAGDPGPIDWQRAMLVGASEAFVVPAQAPELLRALGRSAERQRRASASFGVIGASGGCGASTFAAAMARRLGEGAVLIDADPYSGGLDLLLGAEGLTGARWNDLNVSEGAFKAEDLLRALPNDDGLRVLTSARSKGALNSVDAAQVEAAIRTLQEFPHVVDLSLRMAGAIEAAGGLRYLVMVIPAELRSVAAASVVAEGLRRHQGLHLLPVVRHRGWSGLSVDEVERFIGVDVIAEIPHVAGLTKRVELGGLTDVPRALRQPIDLVLQEAD